jgi:D-glycero-D-manno-heptose 1,7-bisphosphate phosphatase
LIPGVRERLSQIDWTRASFGVASNQGGVGMGYMSHEAAWQLLFDMAAAALGSAPPAGAIEMCPHAPYLNCPCRKPRPLMLRRLMHRFRATKGETLFVGDMERDEEAARRAGVRFLWAHEFFGWETPAAVEARRPAPRDFTGGDAADDRANK